MRPASRPRHALSSPPRIVRVVRGRQRAGGANIIGRRLVFGDENQDQQQESGMMALLQSMENMDVQQQQG